MLGSRPAATSRGRCSSCGGSDVEQRHGRQDARGRAGRAGRGCRVFLQLGCSWKEQVWPSKMLGRMAGFGVGAVGGRAAKALPWCGCPCRPTWTHILMLLFHCGVARKVALYIITWMACPLPGLESDLLPFRSGEGWPWGLRAGCLPRLAEPLSTYALWSICFYRVCCCYILAVLQLAPFMPRRGSANLGS